MIKKLNKIESKKGEDPKVMCNKIEALKVKYWDQANTWNRCKLKLKQRLTMQKLYMKV